MIINDFTFTERNTNTVIEGIISHVAQTKDDANVKIFQRCEEGDTTQQKEVTPDECPACIVWRSEHQESDWDAIQAYTSNDHFGLDFELIFYCPPTDKTENVAVFIENIRRALIKKLEYPDSVYTAGYSYPTNDGGEIVATWDNPQVVTSRRKRTYRFGDGERNLPEHFHCVLVSTKWRTLYADGTST